jgi:hypothetical protein
LKPVTTPLDCGIAIGKTTTYVERFLGKKCAEILMHKGLRKPQAYPWIYRGYSRILDAQQEISADRAKNRSI